MKNTMKMIANMKRTKIEMKKYRLIIVTAAFLFALSILAAGCGLMPAKDARGEKDPEINIVIGDKGESAESGVIEEEKEMSVGENPVVIITMKDGGEIVIELDPAAAPVSVANFLKLTDEGYYDGLTFHRIIPGFMIQGGCPDGDGTGGPDERIKGEFSENGWDNPISHKRGVISMARSNDPDSAGSQFFITNADATSLDGKYAAFGKVTSGMDVVDKITATDLAANGETPLDPPVIESIRRG